MESLRVLLVDDEEEFRATLAKRLRKRNVNVTGAGSGEEALARLDGNPADVVVMDVRMPGMDGIETLREIRCRHPLVQVILLTGYASLDAAIQGMEVGAFDYLVKPMDIDELLYKVQDAGQKKALQEKKIERMETMVASEQAVRRTERS
jgi:DNA-binding NtrC family response regulator